MGARQANKRRVKESLNFPNRQCQTLLGHMPRNGVSTNKIN